MADLHLSTDWDAKLEKVKKFAEDGELGACYFLEMTRNPLTSVFVYGGQKKAGSKKREVHVKYSMQPECYPNIPYHKMDIIKQGWECHLRRKQKEMNDTNSNELNALTYNKYERRYRAVCLLIDASIRDHHGVVCFEDGDKSNDDYRNVYFLHVCDIMNIHVNKSKGCTTDLKIKSQLLPEIKSTMVDTLTSVSLVGDDLEFFTNEIDIFYRSFGHFGNFSFCPIRTSVEKNSDVFLRSSFYMNNEHFSRHQRGKMQEFNQNNTCPFKRISYRSV
jgi:hypothetical protein